MFVIGCDRSGTHLLAQTLEASPDVTVNKSPDEPEYEPAETFQLSLAMARNPARIPSLFPVLCDRYRERLSACETRLWVDKAHPNGWLYGLLRREFPGALFAAIGRDPRGAVVSMMRHIGVRVDAAIALAYPVPCPYMGIMDESWHNLPLIDQLTLKWRSHHMLTEHMRKLPDVRYTQYEDLVRHPAREAKRLSKWLGVEIPPPETDPTRIDAWKDLIDYDTAQRIMRTATE